MFSLLTALALAAFAPSFASGLTTAPPPAKTDIAGTLTYDVATLLYKSPFSLWSDLKKPALLTVATSASHNSLSTNGVLYTLSPSFEAKVNVYSTTLTSTSTVSLPTTTVTLDRFGHAKIRKSSSSSHRQSSSRNKASTTGTQSVGTGTVIFEPALKIETSTSRGNLLIVSTVSPTQTKVWIFVTSSATITTETTIQSTVFEREATTIRATSGKTNSTTKLTHKPTQTPDSYRKKLDKSEWAVKGWQGVFAAVASVLGLLVGGLATRSLRRWKCSRDFNRFWNNLHESDENGTELQATTPPRHANAWPAPRPSGDGNPRRPPANDGFQRVELGVPPPDLLLTHAGTRFGRI